MRFALYAVASAVLAAMTVASAYLEHRTFYTTCVYLSRSSGSMMLLMNLGFLITILSGRLLQKVFFGHLRAIEVERLYERSWFAVTETCLAMTIFRDEFDMRFVAVFTLLLFLKIFHWLAQDRVEYMEQSPVLPRLFHLRMVLVMSILCSLDVLLIAYAVNVSLAKGPSMMFMFGFEYTILASTIVATAVKYALHLIDMRTEEPWENKSMYVFYLELVFDFVKLVTYLIFFSLILTFYGLPLHIVRDVYLTLRSFMHKCRDLVRFQRATRNMNERYPDATEEELSRMTDRTCIICREEMGTTGLSGEGAPERNAGENGAGSQPDTPRAPAPSQGTARPPHAETPKKLPCGHVFHFHCLRSWLERQQSCPTCRRTVLQDDPPATPQTPRPANVPPENPRGPNRPVPLRPEHIAPPGVLRGGIPPGYAGIHPAMLYPTRPTTAPPVQQQPQPTGVNLNDNNPPTATSSSSFVDASGASAHHAPSGPSGTSSTASSASVHSPLYPHPGNQPHLIPLFPIPLPREIQRPRSGSQTGSHANVPLPPATTTSTTTPPQQQPNPMVVPPGTDGIPDFPILPIFSDEQLLRLGENTRQALVERLRMLQTLDAHLWELMTLIGRAISVVPEPTRTNTTRTNPNDSPPFHPTPPPPPPSFPSSSSSFSSTSPTSSSYSAEKNPSTIPPTGPERKREPPDEIVDIKTTLSSSSSSLHPPPTNIATPQSSSTPIRPHVDQIGTAQERNVELEENWKGKGREDS